MTWAGKMMNWAWSRDPADGSLKRICGDCAHSLIEKGAIVPVLREIDGTYRLILEPREGLSTAELRKLTGHGTTHH